MPAAKFTTVDEYIDAFSGIQRKRLEEMRKIVKQAAPGNATEVISYNMPAIKTSMVLVYYAGYAKHIGFYPTGSPIKIFADRLLDYKTSRGAVQFPLEQQLPRALIKEMVGFRAKAAEENAARTRTTGRKKQTKK